jgi:hypothetical protein
MLQGVLVSACCMYVAEDVAQSVARCSCTSRVQVLLVLSYPWTKQKIATQPCHLSMLLQAADASGTGIGPAPGVLPFRMLLSNDRGDTALGKVNPLVDKDTAGFVW